VDCDKRPILFKPQPQRPSQGRHYCAHARRLATTLSSSSQSRYCGIQNGAERKHTILNQSTFQTHTQATPIHQASESDRMSLYSAGRSNPAT
jgi:hypothetical protein